LTLTEVTHDELVHYTEVFDPDDINGAIGELTARWIASGEVAHPEVIDRELRLVEAANRHNWDAFAEISADATYVNHRQLAAGGVHTIAAHMSSIQTMASLVPDMRMELAELLAHSASAVMTHLIVKGTSSDGVVMELPLVVIDLHDGEHVTHMETFDLDQRDLALARFHELNISS
jgi:SnoaL-like domain